ncbi:MAG: hypothetical protein ACE5H3_05295 [Planctomycetota bacterium]
MDSGSPPALSLYARPPDDLPSQVEALLARLQAHPGDLALIQRGWAPSVAIHFGVHAFVVHEARKRLASPDREKDLVEDGG